MTPTDDEARVEEEALDFARAHKKKIAKKWTDIPEKYGRTQIEQMLQVK